MPLTRKYEVYSNLDKQLESPDVEPPEAPENSVFRNGYIYARKDLAADAVVDGNGAAYGYRLIHVDGVDSGEALPDAAYVVDAWPVNRHGQRAPGYDSSSIPVRLDDLEISSGQPAAMAYERKSVFDAFR